MGAFSLIVVINLLNSSGMNPRESELSGLIGTMSTDNGLNRASDVDDFIRTLKIWIEVNYENNNFRLLRSQNDTNSVQSRIIEKLTGSENQFKSLSDCLSLVTEIENIVSNLLKPPSSPFVYIEAAQHRTFRRVIEDCAEFLSDFNSIISLATCWSDLESTFKRTSRHLNKLSSDVDSLLEQYQKEMEIEDQFANIRKSTKLLDL